MISALSAHALKYLPLFNLLSSLPPTFDLLLMLRYDTSLQPVLLFFSPNYIEITPLGFTHHQAPLINVLALLNIGNIPAYDILSVFHNYY